MSKWNKYNNYEGWFRSEKERLKNEYQANHEKNYFSTMPDTFTSFEDFCMGQWQCL